VSEECAHRECGGMRTLQHERAGALGRRAAIAAGPVPFVADGRPGAPGVPGCARRTEGAGGAASVTNAARTVARPFAAPLAGAAVGSPIPASRSSSRVAWSLSTTSRSFLWFRRIQSGSEREHPLPRDRPLREVLRREIDAGGRRARSIATPSAILVAGHLALDAEHEHAGVNPLPSIVPHSSRERPGDVKK
jgi:hypothetical protein